MADHSRDGRAATPDYELDNGLALTDARQYRALFEPTRHQIISLLLERAATGAELAATLDKPKGTIGHHLKVLAEAGLVRVVRTEQVRAITAKYYGRTARIFYYERIDEGAAEPNRTAQLVAHETAALDGAWPGPTELALRHARIPAERATEWSTRLHDLIDEFTRQPLGGDTVYGFVVGIYPTNRRPLPTDVR